MTCPNLRYMTLTWVINEVISYTISIKVKPMQTIKQPLVTFQQDH